MKLETWTAPDGDVVFCVRPHGETFAARDTRGTYIHFRREDARRLLEWLTAHLAAESRTNGD